MILPALLLFCPAAASGPANLLTPHLRLSNCEPPASDTCLAFVTQNLAKGNGNWYTYFRFSEQKLLIRAGDVLSYEVFLDPKNAEPKGGMDVLFEDNGTALRDLGVLDQNGRRSHGDGLIPEAIGKWYRREIPLEKAVGRTANSWNLVFESDMPGRFVEFLDNVLVRHRDGSTTAIYTDGAPPVRELDICKGYTLKPGCAPVDRAKLAAGATLEQLVTEVMKTSERLAEVYEVRHGLAIVEEVLKRHPDGPKQRAADQAKAILAQIEGDGGANPAVIQSSVAKARAALAIAFPAVRSYTDYLVGYAHIDLQWLWEWQETIQVADDTWRQAVNFMDEFPGFCLSASCAALYQAIQEADPALFKRIQEKVKRDQWEIVGGRMCEGDENMPSAESHARHFLYAQRYFREQFGKTAVVGWEPDTFGHSIQSPQIWRLGGCDYLYFCRGGKNTPLFWYQGLDGTKILAFDDDAAGSWYGGDIDSKLFDRAFDFEKANSSRDMLRVYGVGNHGGGPTRENIETAKGWMSTPYLPTVKFSTAKRFFESLTPDTLKTIPVIAKELNPVFEGCYTTHSEIKQLNREAENWTVNAEAAASVASVFGFNYPAAGFRRNWEDICTNHHHDTINGSSKHEPYENTKIMLNRVIADDKDVANRAMQYMTLKVTPKKGGMSVMVFNPLGWTRSGWVDTTLIPSGWNAEGEFKPASCVAESPDGKLSRAVQLDSGTHAGRFLANDVPAFGYKVFNIHSGSTGENRTPRNLDEGYTFENDKIVATFDRENGGIKRLFLKAGGKEFVPKSGSEGRLEVHYEKPVGMSAWTIGEIAGVESPKPVRAFAWEGPDDSHVQFDYEVSDGFGNISKIRQTFHALNDSARIECDVDCDWNARGGQNMRNPFVRVAFDTAFSSPIASFEVPFGVLARPTDGKEMPALRFMDLTEGNSGLSVLNDSKYGCSATGATMRLSLIRSPYDPDPLPNPGHHHWRYAIVPHAGDSRDAATIRAAAEFNQPMLSASVPYDARGIQPLVWSFMTDPAPSLTPTCLKKSEDGKGFIVRLYESFGKPFAGSLEFALPSSGAEIVNFLEDKLSAISGTGTNASLRLRPFQIASIRWTPSKKAK